MHQAPGPGQADPLHNEDVAHEHSDVDIRALVMSAVVLVGVVIVSHLAMYVLFGWLEREAAANEPAVSPLSRPATQMPSATTDPAFSQGVSGPQLLTNEPMALRKFREMEQALLHEAAIDEKTGVARIPIDTAKKLVLERHLVPARADSPAPPTLGTRHPVTGDGSGGRALTMPLPDPAPAGAPPPAAKPHGGH